MRRGIQTKIPAGALANTIRRPVCAGLLLALSAGCASISAPGGERGLPQPAPAPSFVGDSQQQEAYRLAKRAFIWGYPLVRSAQIRQAMTKPEDRFARRPPASPGAPLNRFGHARILSTPEHRAGVAPNNDTLYSLAWLDMDEGPFVLETPCFGSRYYTIQMGQADSSTRVSPGSRADGPCLPPLFIRRPRGDHPLPPGMREIISDQRYLMIAARILVDEGDDLQDINELQDRFALRRWSDHAAGREQLPPVPDQALLPQVFVPEAGPLAFLDALGIVLRDWQARPGERALLDALPAIGLSAGQDFRPDDLPPDIRAAIARGLRDGEEAVRRKTFDFDAKRNGWAINMGGAEFGGDDLLRAAVAMDQIYVLPAEEALYLNARTDGNGEQLDGRNSYRLRFAADEMPPVDAFWSVTVYFAKGFLVPNPVDRYSIGDRTPGLQREADGSLEIILQHERPADRAANWLPVPDEPFMLMMRLYNPTDAVRNGAWVPPPVERIEPR